MQNPSGSIVDIKEIYQRNLFLPLPDMQDWLIKKGFQGILIVALSNECYR